MGVCHHRTSGACKAQYPRLIYRRKMVASLVNFAGYVDFVEINCRFACVAQHTALTRRDAH